MYRQQRSRSPRRSARVSRRYDRQVKRSSTNLEVRDNPVNQAAFWSQDTYSLEEIVAQHPLPQIVRCSSELIPGEERGMPANIHVPLLLCGGRTSKKLLAKHVGFDARGHRLVETDDTIAIPGDYDGNFLRLRARTTQDLSERKGLAQIAMGDAPAFVALSPIVVFYLTEVMDTISETGNNEMPANGFSDIGGSSVATNKLSGVTKASTTSIVQRRVLHPPGSVFLIDSVGRGTARGKKKSREVMILKCSDPRGNRVLISADQPGEFVEVVPPADKENKLSVKSSDLIQANRYPSLVRFVYGDNAPRLRPCSYMFTLVDTFQEESLIGCLLYPNHALLIELPLMSSLRFQLALNSEDLLELGLPTQALDTVNSRRDSFMADLKLKCKFLHRVGQNDGIDGRDELMSATVRTRMHTNESFFYL